MGRFKHAISKLEAELRHRCHRYYVETGIRKYKLASAAGISDTLLKGIDSPDFEASMKTLQRLDEIIPEDWEPTGAGGSGKLLVPAQADPVIGYKIWESDLSRSRKIYVRDELLHGLDPDQMERRALYIEKARDPEGRLIQGRFKLEVLRAIAPQCAIHVFDVGEENPDGYFIEHWDTGTGFWHGADRSWMTRRCGGASLKITWSAAKQSGRTSRSCTVITRMAKSGTFSAFSSRSRPVTDRRKFSASRGRNPPGWPWIC